MTRNDVNVIPKMSPAYLGRSPMSIFSAMRSIYITLHDSESCKRGNQPVRPPTTGENQPVLPGFVGAALLASPFPRRLTSGRPSLGTPSRHAAVPRA